MCALDVRSELALTPNDTLESPNHDIVATSPTFSLITRYLITHRQGSESAWIFFIEDLVTAKPLVAKVLRPYSDSRYKLSKVAERQLCQFEAFQQNCNFTPDVYIGLAPLLNQPSAEDHLLIGEIIQYPIQVPLDEETEYALIMERLPDDRRLDQLLEGDEQSVQGLLETLTQHIVKLQQHPTLTLTEAESAFWGSYARLQSKLEENLAFLSLVLDNVDSAAKATIEHLSSGLRKIFTEEHYGCILEQRVQAGFIKRCHGDIKSLNIWMMPDNIADQQQHYSIKLLDAIDFNPLFCNIDILSDFAMLVIDIWARTGSVLLVRSMIDCYLELTDQDDPPTLILFEYYLFEKAIVAATINILFDNQLKLGMRLLDLAQERLNYLSRRLLYQLA